ncbi:hypothetical protein [Corynebacterium sp. 20_84]
MATAIIEKQYVRAGETEESLEGVLDSILDSFIEDGVEVDYLADLHEQIVAWSFSFPGLSGDKSLDRARRLLESKHENALPGASGGVTRHCVSDVRAVVGDWPEEA